MIEAHQETRIDVILAWTARQLWFEAQPLMFAHTGQIVTHFVDEGPPDRPAITFINSLGTDLRLWEPIAAQLRDAYRVVRYDLRGHGLSDCTPDPYTLDDFASDLHGLLAHLGIQSGALIGISIGGLIASAYAIRYPNAVSHLVLSDTAARIGSEKLWNDRIEMVGSLGMERAAPAIIPVWFSDTFAASQPHVHRGFLNMLGRTPLQGYVASCAALASSDLTDQIHNIQAQTLVLAGEHDRATPPAQAKTMADMIPGARLKLIAGAGHLPCVEQPEAMGQMILSFLQEHGYG